MYGTYEPNKPINQYNPSPDRRNEMGFGQPPAQAPGPSGLDYASFGLNLLGGLGGAYGTYLQAEQADDQFEEAKRMYEEEKSRQAQLDKQNRQQQQTNNVIGAGQYARGVIGDAYGSYSPWAKSAAGL